MLISSLIVASVCSYGRLRATVMSWPAARENEEQQRLLNSLVGKRQSIRRRTLDRTSASVFSGITITKLPGLFELAFTRSIWYWHILLRDHLIRKLRNRSDSRTPPSNCEKTSATSPSPPVAKIRWSLSAKVHRRRIHPLTRVVSRTMRRETFKAAWANFRLCIEEFDSTPFLSVGNEYFFNKIHRQLSPLYGT